VEWRVHPPTQNVHKMLNWLFICNAVMAYAYEHREEIAAWSDLKQVNLDHILKDSYSVALSSVLTKYVGWRKQYMKDMDAQGDRELAEDLLLDVPYSVLS
jgi:hypothetical protein